MEAEERIEDSDKKTEENKSTADESMEIIEEINECKNNEDNIKNVEGQVDISEAVEECSVKEKECDESVEEILENKEKEMVKEDNTQEEINNKSDEKESSGCSDDIIEIIDKDIPENESQNDVIEISDKDESGDKEISTSQKENGRENEITISDFAKSSNESSCKKESDEKYIICNCNEETVKKCTECDVENKPKYFVTYKDSQFYICSEICLNGFKEKHPNNFMKRELRVKVFASQGRTASYNTSIDIQRKCQECKKPVKLNDISVSWETLEFCNEVCLLKYQKVVGSHCSTCRSEVADTIIGKYCVRFGTELKQFCSTSCLEKSKKDIKICPYCQEDLSKSQCIDKFCSKQCMNKSRNITPEKKETECAVCHQKKTVEVEFRHGDKMTYFCGDPCFVAYKFVNNVVPGQCEICGIYIDKHILAENSIYYNGVHYLCSKKCHSIFIVSNRKIVLCFWCKVKKYNFDMVEQKGQDGQVIAMCSVNCLKIFQVSIKSVTSRKHNCDNCKKYLKAMYHLTLSDGSTKHFCCYLCLLTYQSNQPVPILPNLSNKKGARKDDLAIKMPVITHVQSLANTAENTNQVNGDSSEVEKKIRQLVFVKPQELPPQKNIATMCKPNAIAKSTSTQFSEEDKGTQTDEIQEKKILIPVPVPIYVPTPCHMYTMPVPFPVPFPLPIPVPIFIPTTRNSAKGISKEINKIKTKVPADPLEAEILMMAEMVAEDKKEGSDSSSEEEHDVSEGPPKAEESFTESVETPPFGEDIMQIALKMASDFVEPVDLDGAVEANTISVQNSTTPTKKRGRPSKVKKSPPSENVTVNPTIPITPEKPDANLCLKYTFGVNAWKQWVTTKNTEIEKSSKKGKLFKTEILQLTADELNYSLCLFIKEVRKPNGAEYAPDTIYYLCLGIQQYLYENGRIDNIFCDAFYEKFTDNLNDVCQKFSVLYNDSQYIVTRVEEEHLWESKQLGAHSPLVLINTLMFFNTKHFSLTTVDEHLQLSFSHIMKHWKRNPNHPGSRNVLLRFYPPQTSKETRKKKMYEQEENEENPLRCPVKLYEFYLSKCPESVKTRNDVFYLLPERSCVPDSPLWYSTMALDREVLEKMLNRIKMVKEINVALLTV